MRHSYRRSKDSLDAEGLDCAAVEEERLLADEGLSDEARGYLRAMLDHSGLCNAARLEVLKELLTHFEDGRAAGRSENELLEEFGDGRLMGTLIRRSRPGRGWKPRSLIKIAGRVGDVALATAYDVRHSVRGLRRNPAYTTVAVVTLALGIGANTAVFSAINSVLLRPLPYRGANELVLPVLTNPAENVWNGPVGYADYLRWREQNEIFEDVGLWLDWNLNVTGKVRPQRVKAAVVSWKFFDVFVVPPLLGRFFSPEEHERGGGKVAILSEAIWQRRFGADPNVIGTSVFLDEESYEIVGVVPPAARWPRDAEIWIPLTFGSETPPPGVLESDYLGYATVARLQPGIPISQAETVVAQIAKRAAVERPDTRAGSGARLIPIRTSIVGTNTPRTLWLLMGAVGFVLFIACANVANLTLERSLGRRKEISIRAAIGAGLFRSARPLAIECTIVALLGGGLGVAVAIWGTNALTGIAPATLSEAYEFGVDARLLLFALAATLVTGLAFTLAPTVMAARLDIRQALAHGSVRTGSATVGRRARSTITVMQLALSVVLVLGASLTAKSTVGLLRVDPGLRTDGVLTMKVFLPHYRPGSPEDRQIPHKYREFKERIEALPGVVSASTVSGLPLSADGLFDYVPVWAGPGAATEIGANHFANWNIVGMDFFETLGIPLVRGRVFDTGDLPSGPQVAIVSESLARELFPDQDPIGKTIRSRPTIPESPIDVVGVVADVRYADLADAGRNVVYVSQSQTYWRAMAMVVRFDGSPEGRIDEVRDAIWAVAPSAPVMEVRTMEQLAVESLAAHRFVATLVSVFAALALSLAVVGVYGVVNVTFRHRYHELGVRKALGAEGIDIGRLLVGQGAKLALIGIALGLPAGMALTRLVSGLLFEVRATEPVITLGVALLLGTCAIATATMPARRAARIDPVEALRVE